MSKENKKSPEKELKEKLFYNKKNVYQLIEDDEVKSINTFSEDYKQFLNASKTEQGVRNATAFRGEANKTASPLFGVCICYLQNVPVERFGRCILFSLFVYMAQYI